MMKTAFRNDHRYFRSGRNFGPGAGGGANCAHPRLYKRMLSAASLVEIGIVMQARRGDDGARDLDLLLAKLRVEIAAFTARQAEIARKAFRRYGRGRHDAKLNFGACFAYALAKDQSAPLLFKGDDFSQTDVIVAPY